jgi:hypothetical protein
MKVQLTDEDMNTIAVKVTKMLAHKLKERENERPTEMVGVKEAARILGISEGRMREIKDKFPHIKAGSHQQGRLLFVRTGLIESYQKP